jgi:hypothetical protein
MNKYITFSLWGDNKKYCIGAIRNAELALKYYIDWDVLIFYNSSVDDYYINILNQFNNVKLIDCTNANISPWFWRFIPTFNKDNITIIRDCDSRLSEREYNCVITWMNTNYKYLIIRDHERHYDFPMLAGMWGCKEPIHIDYYNTMINDYANKDYYLIDQEYLSNVIWPEAQLNSMIIGIKEDINFKLSRNPETFIGQSYTEFDIGIYK